MLFLLLWQNDLGPQLQSLLRNGIISDENFFRSFTTSHSRRGGIRRKDYWKPPPPLSESHECNNTTTDIDTDGGAQRRKRKSPFGGIIHSKSKVPAPARRRPNTRSTDPDADMPEPELIDFADGATVDQGGTGEQGRFVELFQQQPQPQINNLQLDVAGEIAVAGRVAASITESLEAATRRMNNGAIPLASHEAQLGQQQNRFDAALQRQESELGQQQNRFDAELQRRESELGQQQSRDAAGHVAELQRRDAESKQRMELAKEASSSTSTGKASEEHNKVLVLLLFCALVKNLIHPPVVWLSARMPACPHVPRTAHSSFSKNTTRKTEFGLTPATNNSGSGTTTFRPCNGRTFYRTANSRCDKRTTRHVHSGATEQPPPPPHTHTRTRTEPGDDADDDARGIPALPAAAAVGVDAGLGGASIPAAISATAGTSATSAFAATAATAGT